MMYAITGIYENDAGPPGVGCEIIVTQSSALLHGHTSTENKMEGCPSSLMGYKVERLPGSFEFTLPFTRTFGDCNSSYT